VVTWRAEPADHDGQRILKWHESASGGDSRIFRNVDVCVLFKRCGTEVAYRGTTINLRIQRSRSWGRRGPR
jgi:hypothetical protein